MIGVKDQNDRRDSWHHGGWGLKMIAWFLLVVLMFFVPNVIVSIYGKFFFAPQDFTQMVLSCHLMFMLLEFCLSAKSIVAYFIRYLLMSSNRVGWQFV